jgi:hypothetical protein
MHAQDNVGHKNGGTNDDGSCGIGDDFTTNGDDFATGDDYSVQDFSANGCLQNWGGQICGCGPAACFRSANLSTPDSMLFEC